MDHEHVVSGFSSTASSCVVKDEGVVHPMQNILDLMYFNKFKIVQASRYLYWLKY